MCDDGRLAFIRPTGAQRRIARASVLEYLKKLGHEPAIDTTLAPPTSPSLTASSAVQIVSRKPSSVLERIQKKARKQLSQQRT